MGCVCVMQLHGIVDTTAIVILDIHVGFTNYNVFVHDTI